MKYAFVALLAFLPGFILGKWMVQSHPKVLQELGQEPTRTLQPGPSGPNIHNNLLSENQDDQLNPKGENVVDQCCRLPISQSPIEVLKQLKPSDIKKWEQIRQVQIKEFLSKNSEFMLNGATGDNFDHKMIRTAFGIYEGTLEYDVPETHEKYQYFLRIELRSNQKGKDQDQNRIELRSSGRGGFKSTFDSSILGTDSSAYRVSISWYNFNGDQTIWASHFAFKMNPEVPVGSEFIESLYGLTENLTWNQIGQVRLHRK